MIPVIDATYAGTPKLEYWFNISHLNLGRGGKTTCRNLMFFISVLFHPDRPDKNVQSLKQEVLSFNPKAFAILSATRHEIWKMVVVWWYSPAGSLFCVPFWIQDQINKWSQTFDAVLLVLWVKLTEEKWSGCCGSGTSNITTGKHLKESCLFSLKIWLQTDTGRLLFTVHCSLG